MFHRFVPPTLVCSLFSSAAVAIDIDTIRYAALDQPQINVAVRNTADGPFISFPSIDPSTGDDITGINVPFYYDTGASGGLISKSTANLLGLDPITFDSDGGGPSPEVEVTFGDVGVGGTEFFNVSEQVFVALAPVNEFTDVNAPSSYTQQFGPSRLQIQIAEPTGDPVLDLIPSGFDVLGMPFFEDKVVVMDFRPSNALLGDVLDPNTVQLAMRTHVYDPGTSFNPDTLDSDPGIVPTDLHIQMSYGSFGDYTIIDPLGAPGPTLAHNPFVGTAPADDNGNPPMDVPAAVLRDASRGVTTEASLLFDTGGSVSLLSSAKAAEFGYTIDDSGAEPVLLRDGSPVAPGDFFEVVIEGVGGQSKLLGTYLPELILPTIEGDAGNIDDPNHINFNGAPFFILDLALQNPNDPNDTVILDGVLGMNYFAPSAEIEYLDLGFGAIPFPVDTQLTLFNWMVFDESTGRLGLQLVPEPTTAAMLLGAGLLMIARRRRPTGCGPTAR